MTYAILSDIHANAEALKAVLDDATREGAEAIVCLGDIVGYGPQPAEALKLVRDYSALTIAGNHDDAISGRRASGDFIELAEDAVHRHREALSADDLAFLKNLPYGGEVEGALLAHGDFTEPEAFHYIEDETDAAANFAATEATLHFVGHTHEPALFLVGGSGTVYKTAPQDFQLEEGKRYIVNVGSVGYPRAKDGACFSSYVLYDAAARTVVYRRLPFAVSSVLQRGRNPKLRKRVLAAVCTAGLLLGGALAYFLWSGDTAEYAGDGANVLVAKSLAVSAPGQYVRANLKLAEDSPRAYVRLAFLDAKDRELKVVAKTPKFYFRAREKILEGTARVEVSVGALKADEPPVILEFKPAVTAQ